MPPHPLTNFETQKYYQNEPKLPKIEDKAYLINLDEFKSIALYVNNDNVTYFDSFGVEHILKGIKKFIGTKNIITNIYRIQA